MDPLLALLVIAMVFLLQTLARSAFGGLLAPGTPDTAQAASAPQRAGTAVDQAYREMEHRYDGAGE